MDAGNGSRTEAEGRSRNEIETEGRSNNESDPAGSKLSQFIGIHLFIR